MIRPICRKDTPLLASAKEQFTECWTESMIYSAFDGNRFFGFIDDECLSFITFTVGLDTADIESVFVSESNRRKGVASTLLKLAIDKISSFGLKDILLEVKTDNFAAIKLYQKFGFKEIAVRKKYYIDCDAFVYKKELGI